MNQKSSFLWVVQAGAGLRLLCEHPNVVLLKKKVPLLQAGGAQPWGQGLESRAELGPLTPTPGQGHRHPLHNHRAALDHDLRLQSLESQILESKPHGHQMTELRPVRVGSVPQTISHLVLVLRP